MVGKMVSKKWNIYSISQSIKNKPQIESILNIKEISRRIDKLFAEYSGVNLNWGLKWRASVWLTLHTPLRCININFIPNI
jgi:hypothetical protein